jgi:hypothetical protein
MERLTEQHLPPELWKENYHYPPELFADWKIRAWEKKQKYLQFEGGDPIIPPVTNSERIILMARYAVVRSLKQVPFGERRATSVARCEVESGFVSSLRKARYNIYEGTGGLERGDIELAAEELGVYEIVFPFDLEKVREAEQDEQALLQGIVPTY